MVLQAGNSGWLSSQHKAQGAEPCLWRHSKHAADEHCPGQALDAAGGNGSDQVEVAPSKSSEKNMMPQQVQQADPTLGESRETETEMGSLRGVVPFDASRSGTCAR